MESSGVGLEDWGVELNGEQRRGARLCLTELSTVMSNQGSGVQ